MGLAEILAAKKKAASTQVETQTQAEVIVPPSIINEGVAVTQVEKPMSFAERMRLKKQSGNTSPVAAIVGNADTVMDVSSTSSEKEGAKGTSPFIPAPVVTATTVSIPAKADTTIPVVQPVSLQPSVPIGETENNAEQAYADISRKIEALASLSDTPLENAMKDLKKSLLENPNAVSLMEDTDFGKMVIALRSLTREAAVDALKEKVSGKKGKSKISLDPDAVAAAFEEI